jgi:glucans biosynthesis protein C
MNSVLRRFVLMTLNRARAFPQSDETRRSPIEATPTLGFEKRGAQTQVHIDSPVPQSGGSGSQDPRYHGLDALRAVTMALVVVLHAALPYAVMPIPNLIWAVRDPAAHPAFDLLCWWTLGISSPFYLMSGFFAVELVRGRGLRAFIVNRVQRIVGPFLAAGLTILPATFFVWTGGWLISGRCSLKEIERMRFYAKGYQRNLYGPAHLWSLEYLAIMLVVFCLIWGVLGLIPPMRIPKQRVLGSVRDWLLGRLASPWRPLWLALPTTLILWAGHRQIGLDAMMDRLNSFVPEPFRLGHNAVYFAVGVCLHYWRSDLSRFAAQRWTYMALSLPVFGCRAVFVHWDLVHTLHGPATLALAASGALFAWLLTFGLLGIALGSFVRPSATFRYFADSSYWVYLCHLPIVGLIQVLLWPVAAPAGLKFLVALAGTMALCMASYHSMVRFTFLGLWLHGRRQRVSRGFLIGPHFRIPLGPGLVAKMRNTRARFSDSRNVD